MSLESVCKDRTSKIFTGNTVLLTGASGGLGRSLALQLAHSRVHALVLSGRNEEALKAVGEECKNISPEIIVHIITCDLSNKASVAELSTKALDLCNQRIDVLINNGGVSSRSRFLDTKTEVDEKVMQINFFAGSVLAKGIVPGMVERGYGKIIWISSVQGLFGIPNRTSYASSKFAVQGYCEALRSELADNGISVHVASPGYIRTNLSKSAFTGDGGSYNKLDAATASGADPNGYASSKFAVQGYCEALRSELADNGISVHVASPGYIRTNLSKSAFTGDGGSYNKLDAATASGADPNDVAIDVLNKVAIGKADFVTAATLSAKAAIW
eukprot:CAMPEP_0194227824 /NCGR_PEP_ID=MMETSP0156-20130528/43058_1 /TAXON_ID=33649 /ORGANISM="Thalassionema nitzschioides, Strain L26-B" /LENGTH=328 /DNA_ID=CAMNT_0038960319 /DNA_START=131 /DNA_END=1114 /DNA_ORIENTATION=-